VSVTLFVLNTEEFRPIGTIAAAAGMVGRSCGDYTRWTAIGDEVTLRRDTDIRTSVWFAALTAGCDARIVAFDDDVLELQAESDGARG
jgi:hypothetical protein